jgi:Flp pilus assembly secretin CpaC
MRKDFVRSTIATAVTLGCVVLAPAVITVAGQNEIAPVRQAVPGPTYSKEIIPLKVDLVITRSEGDKKISSLPFSLWVSTGGSTNVRMGSDVPIPTATEGKSGVTYRSVGTFIDCRAESLTGGRFELNLQVNDSSLYSASGRDSNQAGQTVSGFPIIRSFSSSNHLTLRDGQSAEFVMATDKISGEVLKVSVTLNTVK